MYGRRVIHVSGHRQDILTRPYCLTIVIATVSKRVASEFWRTTVPLMWFFVVSEAIPLNSTLAPVLVFPPMATSPVHQLRFATRRGVRVRAEPAYGIRNSDADPDHQRRGGAGLHPVRARGA
jgi:hypothetical protein